MTEAAEALAPEQAYECSARAFGGQTLLPDTPSRRPSARPGAAGSHARHASLAGPARRTVRACTTPGTRRHRGHRCPRRVHGRWRVPRARREPWCTHCTVYGESPPRPSPCALQVASQTCPKRACTTPNRSPIAWARAASGDVRRDWRRATSEMRLRCRAPCQPRRRGCRSPGQAGQGRTGQ